MVAIAKKDYDAAEQGDLAFKRGDLVVITEDTDSYWIGYRPQLPATTGQFPSTYVKKQKRKTAKKKGSLFGK